MGSGMGLVGRRRRGLAGGEGPAADGGDSGLDLIGGGLRERGGAAGLGGFGGGDAGRLAGAMAPGADPGGEVPTPGPGVLAGGPRGGRWRGRRGGGGPRRWGAGG